MQEMIYLSGWGFDGTEIEAFAKNFSEFRITVISIVELLDNRITFAEKLKEILNSKNNPVTLVGWSIGAMVILEALTLYNLPVNKLVLFSPTLQFTASTAWPHGTEIAILEAMKAKLKSDRFGTLTKFYRKSFSPLAVSEVKIREYLQVRMFFTTDLLEQGLEYLIKTNLQAKLAVSCPTLIFHGEMDKIIPWQAGERVGQAIPNSNFIKLKQIGHCILQQLNPQIVNVSKEFLSEQK